MKSAVVGNQLEQSVLTIGIPTCGRPRAISTCVYSIKQHLNIPYRLLVVDSTGTDINVNLRKQCDNLTHIMLPRPISPAASRKIIAEKTATEYLLFLDDDVIVRDNSIEILLQHLTRNSKVSIVSGALRDYGHHREIGQRFNFGTRDSRPVVWKSFISISEARRLKLTAIRVDATQGSMLLRTDIFHKVTFDEQYDFFYELFDFFMQCYKKGIIVEVLPGVTFEHRPGKYEITTLRQSSDIDVDRSRFVQKWGLLPIGKLSQTQRRALIKYFVCKTWAEIRHTS